MTRRAFTLVLRFSGLFLLYTAGLAMIWAADVPEHVPGRLIVGIRQSADPALAARTLQFHRALVKKQLPELGATLVDVPEESSDAILASLRQSGLYEYVERDYYGHTAAATPNDPSYASQWYLPKIQAPQAWSVSTGSASIVIAVIDSGVDTTHPDLAPKLAPGWNYISNSATIVDTMGHGTAVSGTAAAASNNAIGITGVSWASMIMPLVVVDSTDYASYSNMASAIQYAADHGARVINLSVGGTSSSSLLQNAVNYAWSKGAVLVASAMNNSNSTPNYPAACTNVIAVSATDNNDALASFSNYGNWITLAAPGSNILTTTVGGGTGYWYGTSFSSPIVAGVAALALSVNPALTNTALVALLEQNADDLGTPGFDSSFGWGRVNAYRAVTAAQAGVTPVNVTVAPTTVTLTAAQSAQLSATVTGSTGVVSWSLSAAVGSISSTGLYTAPASVTAAQSVNAMATVGGVTASAAIVVNPPVVPVTVSVTPKTATLTPGQTVQLAATVTGSTSAVSWSLSAAVGTISSTGLYTAPASVTAAQSVNAMATVGGVTASAAIVVNPPVVPVTVSVTPKTATLTPGQTVQLAAAVTGTTSAVSWSLSAAVGSISSTGLYTARPASLPLRASMPWLRWEASPPRPQS